MKTTNQILSTKITPLRYVTASPVTTTASSLTSQLASPTRQLIWNCLITEFSQHLMISITALIKFWICIIFWSFSRAQVHSLTDWPVSPSGSCSCPVFLPSKGRGCRRRIQWRGPRRCCTAGWRTGSRSRIRLPHLPDRNCLLWNHSNYLGRNVGKN